MAPGQACQTAPGKWGKIAPHGHLLHTHTWPAWHFSAQGRASHDPLRCNEFFQSLQGWLSIRAGTVSNHRPVQATPHLDSHTLIDCDRPWASSGRCFLNAVPSGSQVGRTHVKCQLPCPTSPGRVQCSGERCSLLNETSWQVGKIH